MANDPLHAIVKRLDHVFEDVYYDDIVDRCTLSMKSITITSLEKQDSSEQRRQIEPARFFRPELPAPPYS